MKRVTVRRTVKISGLSKNFAAVMREVRMRPVGVLKNGKVEAFLISADAYESMLSRLDDCDLLALVCARSKETSVPVRLDEL